MKIDIKINIENYLKFSSKNVVGAELSLLDLVGGVHPTSKDGSSPMAWGRALVGGLISIILVFSLFFPSPQPLIWSIQPLMAI